MIAKKMVTEIEAVTATMLDRFSGVDQRLTTIEQLLNKIIETQNQILNPPEKGKKVILEEGDGVPSYESRAEIPSYGWVGLYTNNQSDFRQKNEASFGFHYRPDEVMVNGRFVNKFVKADETVWDGKKSENNTEKKRGKKVVKASQVVKTKESSAKTDVLVQDSSKSDKCGKKDSVQNEIIGKCGGFVESDKGRNCSKLVEERTDLEDARGPKRKHPDISPFVKEGGQEEISKDSLKSDRFEIKESCAGSSGSWDKLAYKTDAYGEKPEVSPQDSIKPDQCGKKDSGSCGKSVQNEVTGKCEKGCDWSKLVEEKTDVKDDWCPWGNKNGDYKRERNNSPVGPFTETKRRLDMFTSDEQEILNDIEPIIQSVRRILNPNEYNDSDPLSPDDQTFILNSILSHHPDKAQKMGVGIDYIMVSKHRKHQMSRCFYVVSLDGRKEDFSYKKCLENLIREKYPDKANKFIPKYFKPNRPLHCFSGNRYDQFRSGYKGGTARRQGHCTRRGNVT